MPSSKSNVAIAYRTLKQAILENRLGPGTQVLEQEAATQLEMSRTPVREAMLMLQKDGLVEMRPRQGMHVVPITVGDISEIYEVLVVIETLAIRKLAENPISEEQAKTLLNSVLLVEEAIEKNDLSLWTSADKKFHEDVVKFSGNVHLKNVFLQLWDRSQRARCILLKRHGKPINTGKGHGELLDLIKLGKAEEASNLQKSLRAVEEKAIRKLILEMMNGVSPITKGGT